MLVHFELVLALSSVLHYCLFFRNWICWSFTYKATCVSFFLCKHLVKVSKTAAHHLLMVLKIHSENEIKDFNKK